MALTKNLAVPRGSKVTLNFSNTPAGTLPGTMIKFTVSRAPNSATKIIPKKACSAPDSDGKYNCSLSSSDTNVTPGKYFWDTRIDEAGNETLLGSGLFVITGIAQLPEAAA